MGWEDRAALDDDGETSSTAAHKRLMAEGSARLLRAINRTRVHVVIHYDNPFAEPTGRAKAVVDSVAESFGLTGTILRGDNRRREIAEARSVAAQLLLQIGYSDTDIGRQLGNRDRTTIAFSTRKTFHRAMRDQFARGVYEKHYELLEQAQTVPADG